MPGKKHSVKRFLSDEYFQQWIKAPNAENNAYWQEFLHLHSEAKEEIEGARKFIAQLDFYEEPHGEATKRRIKENIDKAIQEDASQNVRPLYPELFVNQPKKVSSLKKWMSIAATFTGLLLLVGAYLMFFAQDFTTYTTDYAQTRTIVLPDQSVVTLNANSTLRVAEDNWDNTLERKVWLEGEAFFEVEKRKSGEGEPAKFVVHTGDVLVEVLGTKFNVNARHQETKVVLTSGSVKLNIKEETENAEKQIMMKPGEMVAVSKDKQEIVKKVVNTSYYTAWKENKLIFEHTPVAEIIQLIEDNYGLNVCIHSSSLLEKKFTGAAPADNLNILLTKMSVVYNLKISRNDRGITIEDK